MTTSTTTNDQGLPHLVIIHQKKGFIEDTTQRKVVTVDRTRRKGVTAGVTQRKGVSAGMNQRKGVTVDVIQFQVSEGNTVTTTLVTPGAVGLVAHLAVTLTATEAGGNNNNHRWHFMMLDKL